MAEDGAKIRDADFLIVVTVLAEALREAWDLAATREKCRWLDKLYEVYDTERKA